MTSETVPTLLDEGTLERFFAMGKLIEVPIDPNFQSLLSSCDNTSTEMTGDSSDYCPWHDAVD